MNKTEGDWYCPKCQTYILGQNVTYTERHDNCGEPAEWHTAEHQMPKIPRWISWIIIAALAVMIISIIAISDKNHQKRKQEAKDQKTTEDYSRMSDSQEIQEAYMREYPLK